MEAPEGTAQQEKATTARSHEKMEEGRVEVWMWECQEFVLEDQRKSEKALKMV